MEVNVVVLTSIALPPKSSWYQLARLAPGYRWGPVFLVTAVSPEGVYA
jgi:hypothetical protein